VRPFTHFAVGLLILGAFSLAAPAAHADFDLRVSWPTVAEVNPAVDSYRISVSDTGPGALEARWLGHVVPIDHFANLDLSFVEDGVGRVEIWRCDPSCEWAGVSSPTLRVFHHLDVAAEPLTVGTNTSLTTRVTISPVAAYSPIQLDWRVVSGTSPDGPVLAHGTASATPTPWQTVSVTVPLALTLPPDLTAGASYSWVTDVSMPFAGGSLVASSGAQPLIVDQTPPEITATQQGDLVEPWTDGYLDSVSVVMSSSEDGLVGMQVLDEGGAVVTQARQMLAYLAGHTATLSWNGRDAGTGKPVAPGGYRLLVTSTDRVGNAATASFPVVVGDGKLQFVSWHSPTLRPSSGIKARLVGRCARLQTPSSEGWPGSIGYLANARCDHQHSSDSLAWTEYSAVLPHSYQGRYQSLQFEAQALVQSGRRYLEVGPLARTDGSWNNYAQRYSASLAWRSVGYGKPSRYITATDDGATIRWRVGDQDDSRIAVKRLRLSVDYFALVHQDGTVEIPQG
jgi:hypothetical protein